jgi:hypothetical protein
MDKYVYVDLNGTTLEWFVGDEDNRYHRDIMEVSSLPDFLDCLCRVQVISGFDIDSQLDSLREQINNNNLLDGTHILDELSRKHVQGLCRA